MPRWQLGLLAGVGLAIGQGCASAPPADSPPAATPLVNPVLFGMTPRYFTQLQVVLPDSSYVAILAIVPRERVARLFPLTGQASRRFPPGIHEIPARQPPPTDASRAPAQLDRIVSVVFPGGPGGSHQIADLSHTPSGRDVPKVTLLAEPSQKAAGPPSRKPRLYVLTSRMVLRAADLDRLLAKVDRTATPESVMAALAHSLGWQDGPRPWGGAPER